MTDLATTHPSMKWKPPSENSVDFKLELMFPALASSSSPDYSAMPIFRLHQWLGEDKYEFFDTMTVSADMWAE
jgi:mRNA guanylyltransferase